MQIGDEVEVFITFENSSNPSSISSIRLSATLVYLRRRYIFMILSAPFFPDKKKPNSSLWGPIKSLTTVVTDIGKPFDKSITIDYSNLNVNRFYRSIDRNRHSQPSLLLNLSILSFSLTHSPLNRL